MFKRERGEGVWKNISPRLPKKYYFSFILANSWQLNCFTVCSRPEFGIEIKKRFPWTSAVNLTTLGKDIDKLDIAQLIIAIMYMFDPMHIWCIPELWTTWRHSLRCYRRLTKGYTFSPKKGEYTKIIKIVSTRECEDISLNIHKIWIWLDPFASRFNNKNQLKKSISRSYVQIRTTSKNFNNFLTHVGMKYQ